MSIQQLSINKCFGGWQGRYSHNARTVHCTMQFAVYMPPGASDENPVPAVYWLSGLTCTDENFIQKAGAQRVAASLGVALVAADTSPRGEDIPDDPEGSYDFGVGAGFYVNATQSPWNQHYLMYDYILKELPAVVEANFPVTDQKSISGHSMGGHGALVLALQNPEAYRSVSAFSPICNPINCPWGQKAFSNYLGEDQRAWAAYDSSVLMANARKPVIPALVDQGTADQFLERELKPETLEQAARQSGYPLTFYYREGYDHSYYFIASFIEAHLRFHAQKLLG